MQALQVKVKNSRGIKCPPTYLFKRFLSPFCLLQSLAVGLFLRRLLHIRGIPECFNVWLRPVEVVHFLFLPVKAGMRLSR